ncbi:rhodanese-like domain-containing protein [Deferribacteraceae bacterium V6Fe1]|nr:rhodanese-like domain-containing protein [Deferribacteraceae bacterium V6Fe1]
MENLLRNLNMEDVLKIRFSPDKAIELLNKDEAILLDIRYPFETEKWGMKFSIEIPLNELPDRVEELPKDKVIICACPQDFRSNIACQFLNLHGFHAKVLVGGLLALTDRLKGMAAKDLTL